jgi:hypothetical protein
MERVARALPEWGGDLPNRRQPAAGEPSAWRNSMKPQNQEIDGGGVTVDAVIEMLRTVTTLLSPDQRLAMFRILRDGMNMVPPDTDPRLRARMNVSLRIPAKVADSIASALEPFAVWQQSANTTPDEIRGFLSFEEYRPLFEELLATAKVLGFNLNHNHFAAISRARAAYRSGRALGGPEGLSIQPHLDAVAPALVVGGRSKRKKPAPADERK